MMCEVLARTRARLEPDPVDVLNEMLSETIFKASDIRVKTPTSSRDMIRGFPSKLESVSYIWIVLDSLSYFGMVMLGHAQHESADGDEFER